MEIAKGAWAAGSSPCSIFFKNNLKSFLSQNISFSAILIQAAQGTLVFQVWLGNS